MTETWAFLNSVVPTEQAQQQQQQQQQDDYRND